MARRLATAEEVRASYLGFGLFGVLAELVGATLHDGTGRGVITWGMLLTVAAAVGYGRLWYRLHGRRFLDRWLR